MMVGIAGQRVYGDEKRFYFPSSEATCQTLVFIVLAAVYAQTFVLACDELRAHAGLFAKEQHVELDAVSLGYL